MEGNARGLAVYFINCECGREVTREGRLSRALTRVCSFIIALRDWQALVNLMESFLAVQKWIAELGRGKLLTKRKVRLNVAFGVFEWDIGNRRVGTA